MRAPSGARVFLLRWRPCPRYHLRMTQIINLRTARKQASRAQARKLADANAAKHGRSKAERAMQEAQATKARAHLDAHQREREE